MNRRIVLTLTLVMALLMGGSCAQAQAPLPPLAVLGLVPDLPAAREYPIQYVDYAALGAIRPGAVRPENAQQFEDGLRNADRGIRLYLAALQGAVAVGDVGLAFQFLSPTQTVRMTGIDIFRIDQLLTFGQPPRNGMYLLGRFDLDAIQAAYGKRGYNAQDQTRILWCGPKGCDKGVESDPQNRVVGDPFGGELGRQQPILMGEKLLMSTPDFTLMQAVIKTIQGEMPNIGADADFKAAGDALLQDVTLAQAVFITPKVITRTGAPTPVYPTYQLLAFGHAGTKDAQLARVAFVFPDMEKAKAAADKLPELLARSEAAEGKSWAALIAERGGKIDTPQVIEDKNNKRVVVMLTLRGVLEPARPGADGTYVWSGALFSLLLQGFYGGGLEWLAF